MKSRETSLVTQTVEATCNVGDLASMPGLGRSPGGGNGNHSSILGLRIPWIEESSGQKALDTNEQLSTAQHMKSKNMVLMILFAEQQWRTRHRKQTCGPGVGEGEVGLMERIAWKHMLPFALWYMEFNEMLCDNLEGCHEEGDGKGVLQGRHMYTFGWFMLIYSRNQQNIIKQLSI